MRLLNIVDWLPPDFGAIGQYALLESQRLAAEGHEVTLVGLTRGQSTTQTEAFGDGHLTTVRLHSANVPKSNLKARALWTLTANFKLVRAALSYAPGAERILFTGSPPFLEYALVPLQPWLRARLVFRIADFHPECLIAELGDDVPSWLTAFHQLSIQLRRWVPQFEVLGEDAKRLLIEQGIPASKIRVVRSESPVTFEGGYAPFERPEELANKRALLYSGTVAHAHELTTFVDGYEIYHQRGPGDVVLWLNATGVQADNFEQELRKRGLPVYRTMGVPLERLAALLSSVDAHLITLRNEFVGLCVPSKVYSCVASGKPVMFVGSADSDVHLVCSTRASDRYLRADVGDTQAVARALSQLSRSASHELVTSKV
ncbi:MAG: hypothetical protein RJA70_3632 [Pseudomonadota bacterium]|jgi:hypothetical protein